MELPFICRNCNFENWVDPENLEIWPIDKLTTAEYYVCAGCDSREVVLYSTLSLKAALRKISSKKGAFFFQKLVKKAQGLYERGEKSWRDQISKLGCH